MSPHGSSVDHHVFVVVIAGQEIENTLENSTLSPSTEALVNDVPFPETLWKITPRNAGSVPIENGFYKQSIVCRVSTDMAFAAGKKILDPIPLIVS